MGASLRGMLLALLAFALYSTHDTIIKELGGRYAVFQIILFGNLFAFLPMSVMILADGRNESFRPHHPWLVTLRTLATVAGMVCGFYAFTVLPLAETYALIFMMPLIITLLSVPILGERIGINRMAASIVGFIGVLVVLRPGSAELSLGHVAALATAIFGSIAVIFVRKIGSSERSAVLILFPLIASICIMGAIMPWTYRPVDGIDMALMAIIGFLVVFAQLTIIAAYRAAPAGIIAPIQYSQILWAVGYGYVFFNEIPDVWPAVGAAIVIASGIFVVVREATADVSKTQPVLTVNNHRPDIAPAPPRPADAG